MSDAFTPDEEQVREQYTQEQPPQIGSVAEKRAEFDRFIARIKAEALREALLSEGSVERAARALYETDREEYDGDRPWPPRPRFIEDMYRERARAALTAAIGDK